MMLTATRLLDREPDPSEADIREAISGQLCRCTGYHNIVKRSAGPPSTRPRR